MKNGRILIPFTALLLLFSIGAAALFAQDSGTVPALKYADPDSSILMFFDWGSLVKKGLTWDTVKGLSRNGMTYSRENLIKKMIETPSDIGIDPLKRSVVFATFTNGNDSRISGVIISLSDQTKLENFLKNDLGDSNSGSIKKTDNYSFITTNTSIMGWNSDTLLILNSDAEGIDLKSEMSELFANAGKTGRFSSQGLQKLLPEPYDISMWLSMDRLAGSAANPGAADFFTNVEISVRLEFLQGQAVLNIDSTGFDTNYSFNEKKIPPALLTNLPGKTLIGFLYGTVDLNKLNDTNEAISNYMKALDAELSALGIDKKDISACLGGDFLLFSTDIGNKKSDIELGLSATVRDRVKLGRILTKLVKEKILIKDTKAGNVYIIDNNYDKSSRMAGSIYIVLKNDKIYLASNQLKDYLLSKKTARPAVSPELLSLANNNSVAGYVDMTGLIKKLMENGKGEPAFAAAMIGNFFKDIRLTANQTAPDSANLRLEFNLTDDSENSLKVILDKVGSYTGGKKEENGLD
jgi:hypothetical protein